MYLISPLQHLFLWLKFVKKLLRIKPLYLEFYFILFYFFKIKDFNQLRSGTTPHVTITIPTFLI
jgi:hypothetical protein